MTDLGFRYGGRTEWRGVDLSNRIQKINRAFKQKPVRSSEDVPIVINTPAYFLYGTSDKPSDYHTSCEAMYNYQAEMYFKHLQNVDDDMVPYFFPWYGTGVVASAFGMEQIPPKDAQSEWICGDPILEKPSDIQDLKLPDPEQDGLMPVVLDCIRTAAEKDDLPVGLTDIQGPLDTAGQLCGHSNLFMWMRMCPEEVHTLMDLITDTLIIWIKAQKAAIGEPPAQSNGLQGIYSPGCGIWVSEDDLVMIGPGDYRTFVRPYLERLFGEFGGGSVHFCGDGYQHVPQILETKNVVVLNNSPMGLFPQFAELRTRIAGRLVHQVQDIVPLDIEGYFTALLEPVDDFTGMMFASMLIDELAMEMDGKLKPTDEPPFSRANRMVKVIREKAALKLKG
jgi:hypothetical protein